MFFSALRRSLSLSGAPKAARRLTCRPQLQALEDRITPSLISTSLVAPYGIDCYANLLLDGSGNLYGTTTEGGGSGLGTVFELTAGASSRTASVSGSPDASRGQATNTAPAVLDADSFGLAWGLTPAPARLPSAPGASPTRLPTPAPADASSLPAPTGRQNTQAVQVGLLVSGRALSAEAVDALFADLDAAWPLGGSGNGPTAG
jgi:uncharacterized repeat protein (TIGR03803 family)